jgi:hypothetical protein
MFSNSPCRRNRLFPRRFTPCEFGKKFYAIALLEFYDEKVGKEQVDADSRHLIRMIELVRKGLGHEEDIGSALIRLQRSGRHYGKCLWEKYSTEDKAQWQDREN